MMAAADGVSLLDRDLVVVRDKPWSRCVKLKDAATGRMAWAGTPEDAVLILNTLKPETAAALRALMQEIDGGNE
jgi:hypothetical protein